jgi:hypothetical protein
MLDSAPRNEAEFGSGNKVSDQLPAPASVTHSGRCAENTFLLLSGNLKQSLACCACSLVTMMRGTANRNKSIRSEILYVFVDCLKTIVVDY